MKHLDHHRRGGARAAVAAVVLVVSALCGSISLGQVQAQQPTSIAAPPNAAVPNKAIEIEASIEPSKFAGKELRRSVTTPGQSGDAAADAGTSGAAANRSSGFGFARVAASLGVVLVLIFGLRYFGQKWFAPGTARGSGRTVETLSRAIIGPKQQVLLIRVGKRRVVVVGDSGGKLSSLDTITDADEIAELVGQVHTDKLGPAANAFAGLFGKSAERFAERETDRSEPIDKEMVDESVSSTQRDLESLLSKVRRVSGKLGS